MRRAGAAVGIGFAILGPLAAIATAMHSDLAGLAECAPIGLFILWLVVVAWFALVQARQSSDRRMRAPTSQGGAPYGANP